MGGGSPNSTRRRLYLNLEDSSSSVNSNVITKEIKDDKNIPSLSMILIHNLSSLQEKFSDINTLLLSENDFTVNGDNINLDYSNLNPNFSEQKGNFNELLIELFEIENNLKFKIFETETNGQSIQNVVLKFSSFENSLNALSELVKFENISLKKAFKDDSSNSIHLYISILNDED